MAQLAIPIEHTLGRFSYELAFAESRRDDDFLDPDDSFGLVSTSTESRTRRARLTTRTSTAIGTIVAGGEYERAEIDDVTNFGPNLEDNERTEKSLFIEDRFKRDLSDASRFEVSAGVRYDDFHTFGAETSPRIAAAWIGSSNKLRAAFGEAFERHVGFWSEARYELDVTPLRTFASNTRYACEIDQSAHLAEAADIIDVDLRTIASLQRTLAARGKPNATVEERYRALEPVIVKTHNLSYIAEFALRRQWATLTEQERQRFIAAFQRLSVMPYAARFGNVAADAFRPIEAGPPDANGRVQVTTAIKRTSAAPR